MAWLLADAELRKDLAQNILIGNLARDGAELVERVAKIQREEVAGDARAKRLPCTLNRVAGRLKMLAVTLVGHDHRGIGAAKGFGYGFG